MGRMCEWGKMGLQSSIGKEREELNFFSLKSTTVLNTTE